MALIQGAFPYDINNVIGGRIRLLLADPADVVVPLADGIGSVIDLEAPYAARTGWVDIGATSEAFSYTRGFDVEGWEIQQAQGNIIEEVTSTNRTVTLSLAEFRQDLIELVENSAITGDVASGAGVSAQRGVRFGSFSSLARHRIAFISQRALASGTFTESDDTTKRGGFAMGVGYSCQISADDATIEFDKGTLSAFTVGFTFFPNTTNPDTLAAGQEYGAWYYERIPQTLT